MGGGEFRVEFYRFAVGLGGLRSILRRLPLAFLERKPRFIRSLRQGDSDIAFLDGGELLGTFGESVRADPYRVFARGNGLNGEPAGRIRVTVANPVDPDGGLRISEDGHRSERTRLPCRGYPYRQQPENGKPSARSKLHDRDILPQSVSPNARNRPIRPFPR